VDDFDSVRENNSDNISKGYKGISSENGVIPDSF